MKKPNILMIVCDQLRYDCIGFSKKYPVKTPNIDALAEEGIFFTKAYTSIPICCPARQEMLSGIKCEKFGNHWNYDISLPIGYLKSTDYSFVNDVKDAGYNTAYIGKWHVSPEETPLSFGFDHYVDLLDFEIDRAKYPGKQYGDRYFGEVNFLDTEDCRTHFLAKKAKEKLSEYAESENPFFMRVDFSEPHLPCRPSQEFFDMYKPEDIVEWDGFGDEFKDKPYIQKQHLLNWEVDGFTWEDWRPVVHRYYAMITQIDDAIGKIINMLKEKNLFEDTAIFFTADHGDMCGSHGMMDKHYVMYEDILHVPYIVRYKGFLQGVKCNDFTYNTLDMAPTVLDILGLPQKDFFDGKSFYKNLTDKDYKNGRDCLISTYNGQQHGLYTIRTLIMERYKYCFNPTDVDELYDLKEDEGELINLIHDPKYKELVKSFREKLFNELEALNDTMLKNKKWFNAALLGNKKR